MKKILYLLLKIFLMVLLVFLVLVSTLAPAIILPTLVLYGTIAYLWIVNKKPASIFQNVKVISKTQEHQSLATKHYITFEFEDGTRKTVHSNIQLYGSILEGEIGTLSYREYLNYAYVVDFKKVDN